MNLADHFPHLIEQRLGYRRGTVSPKLRRRVEARRPLGIYRRLAEGSSERQALDSLLLSAIDHFSTKQAELRDLPMESGERATVESALGLLRSAQSSVAAGGTNESMRTAINGLTTSLREIMSSFGTESDFYLTMSSLVNDLGDLYISIDPSASDDDLGADASGGEDEGGNEPSPDIPDSPPDEPSPPGEDEDEDEDDNTSSTDGLAKALGLL